MNYPRISLLVQAANQSAFGSNKYMLDLDFITVDLYNYQNRFDSPKNETSQDIVWTGDRIMPRNQWAISEEIYNACVANIQQKRRC